MENRLIGGLSNDFEANSAYEEEKLSKPVKALPELMF